MTKSEELARLVKLAKKVGVSYFEIGLVTGYSSASVKNWSTGRPPKDMEGINEAIKKRIVRHIAEIMKEVKDLDIGVGNS